MRRRIGVEGGETGDETGTDTEGGEGMDEETGGMGGVYGPADAKVRKKGIDWNLRLTEAFSAYLTPVPPEEEVREGEREKGAGAKRQHIAYQKYSARCYPPPPSYIPPTHTTDNPLLVASLLAPRVSIN